MALFSGMTMTAKVATGQTVAAHRFIKIVGEDTGIPVVQHSGANERAEGIALEAGTAGADILYVPPSSFASVEASAAIDASSGAVDLASAANGKAAEATVGQKIVGRAYTSATQSGELVRARVMDGGVFTAESGERTFGGKLEDCDDNTTVRSHLFTAAKACTVLAAYVAFHAIPASALGTVLGTLKFWDKSGNAEHDMMDAALDLEGLTNKEGAALTLNTAVDLEAGDTVYFEAVSNNADMTGGTGGSWGVVIQETE